MGLLYPFPISEDEVDRIDHSADKSEVILKTYGLPMMFWGYLGALFVVLISMIMAIKAPLLKMQSSEDQINQIIAYIVWGTFFLIAFCSLCFFFYEKWLIKKGEDLTISHRLFFLPIYKKNILLDKSNSFSVDHYLDSPNIAKKTPTKENRAFQNQGYYMLRGQLKSGQYTNLDRGSRKADLEKIKNILSIY